MAPTVYFTMAAPCLPRVAPKTDLPLGLGRLGYVWHERRGQFDEKEEDPSDVS